VALVDAVVEDRDLHPVSVRAGRRGRERPGGGACCVSGRPRIPRAGDDGGDPGDRLQARDTSLGKAHGEPVEHDPVAPAHVGARDRALDPRGERILVIAQFAEVRDAERRPEAEAARLRGAAQGPALGDRARERRRLHRHDDFDVSGTCFTGRGRAADEENRSNEATPQGREIVDAPRRPLGLRLTQLRH
jgi:hypothetical protein